jgi:hypothetical protein
MGLLDTPGIFNRRATVDLEALDVGLCSLTICLSERAWLTRFAALKW